MSRSLMNIGTMLRHLSIGGLLLPKRYRAHYIHADLVAPIDDVELECKYEIYLNRSDIDGWELRKALNDLHGMDLIPDPSLIKAALKACRRINEYALAIRYLEAVKDKCGWHVNTIYPYIMQEIKPTLEELGIETIEEIGFDKPELYLQDYYTYIPPKE